MTHQNSVVFVVDDDASVRRSLALLVESAGWQAKTFGSAQEFLSSPRVSCSSCLVLDLDLPDLDGLELQKRVAGGVTCRSSSSRGTATCRPPCRP
jgi:FixJ family two-component response regulator